MHRSPGKIRRIALYGPFGWGNLGDAAIQESMIHHARERLPDVEIIAVSLNPENTEEIHAVPAIPILRSWRPRRPASPSSSGTAAAVMPGGESIVSRCKQRVESAPLLGPVVRRLKRGLRPLAEFARELRFLGRGVQQLRGVDLFLVSGGGQIADFWGGPLYHPYSLFKWIVCARLAGAEVHVVSVGAGPIEHPWSGRLLSWGLRLAHSRSYRDPESLRLLQRWGFTRHDRVHSDLAFGLPRESRREAVAVPRVMGVSPLAYFHPHPGPWPSQDVQRYRPYLERVQGFVEGLMSSGLQVHLFCSQIRNDRYAFDDLLEALRENGHRPGAALHAEPTRGLEHLLGQIDDCDAVLSSRLHGVILSYLLHKPVIALSCDPKIDAVMRAFGQSRFCLDIDRFSLEQLQDRWREMVEDYPRLRAQIEERARANRHDLEQQFDRLFGVRPGKPSAVTPVVQEIRA